MANQEREPFVLDFPNGQRVEDILKKADADYSKAEIDAKMASKATMSDVQRETQNLQNQINEIVRAPESGGDVAAEVAQARVDADGVTHATLKARCDSDADKTTQLKEDLTKVKNASYIQSETPAEYTPVNCYYSNGVATETTTANCHKIDVSGTDIVRIKDGRIPKFYDFYDFLDANGEVIQFENNTSDETQFDITISVPSGAKYIAVSSNSQSVVASVYKYASVAEKLIDGFSEIVGNHNYPVEWIETGYINGTTGQLITPFTGWKYTDFIEIGNGVTKIHIVSDTYSTTTNNAFYDANKDFLEVLTIGADVLVDVPDGAKYFRLSNKVDAIESVSKPLIPLSEKANKDDIPIVDTTLSVAGDSAEAKATGDRFSILESAINNEVIAGFSRNRYINLSGITTDFTEIYSSTGMSCKVIDCEAQDTFTILYGNAIGSGFLWGFTDEIGTILSKAGLNAISDYTVIKAPTGAKKLVVNFLNGVLVRGIATRIVNNHQKKGLDLIGYKELSPDIELDKYFNASTNKIVNVTGYNITKPVFVEKGKTITVIARGISNIVGMINTCDDVDYTNAKAVVACIDGEEREYTYTTYVDTYVFISYRYLQGVNTYFFSMFVYNEIELNDVYKANIRTLHTQDVIKDRISFSGKNLVTFGDSIMYGASSGDTSGYNIWTDSWIRRFTRKTGATLTNLAVGGACWTVGVSTQFKDIVTQVHEFCTDSSSVTPDVIFIGAGTNDWGHNATIGSYGDTSSSTLYGALKTVFEELKTAHPDIPVVIITPINRTLADTPTKVEFLNEIRNAIFEMAITYDHYVIDGEKMAFPMERGQYQELTLYDETHPTPLGHVMYYHTVYDILCL